MSKIKIVLDKELNLITNCITSTEFLKTIFPLLRSQYFKTSYSKTVFNWISEYFEQNNLAPGKDIQSIYTNKKYELNMENSDDENNGKDNICIFLEHLSKRYEGKDENEISDFENIEYATKEAIAYINERSIELIKEETDFIKAQEMILNYKPVTLTKSEYNYRCIDDIDLTPPDWLLKDFLLKNSFNMFFGEPGAAKTFAALDIGLSIASGIDYHTHKTKEKAPVLYWAGEGIYTIKRRVTAWKVAHEVSERIPFMVLNNDISLVDYKTLIPIEEALKEINEKHGTPQLLIIDTWARALGEDENATKQAGLAVKNLDKLRKLFDTSILIIHHTGLNEKDRARGSSAVNGASDNVYKVTIDSSKIIRITSTKCKDGEPCEPMSFKLVDYDLGIKDEHNLPITSAALHMTNYEPIKKKVSLGKNQRIAIRLLDEVRGENDSVLIEDWKNKMLSQGFNLVKYHQTKSSLFEKGLIYIEDNYISPFVFRSLKGKRNKRNDRAISVSPKNETKTKMKFHREK